MCRQKNVLLEILFSKSYWGLGGVNVFVDELLLKHERVYDDAYSEYYIYIYEDRRLYTNLRSTSDPRRHIVFVYGDER
jgi:hypothetical protein